MKRVCYCNNLQNYKIRDQCLWHIFVFYFLFIILVLSLSGLKFKVFIPISCLQRGKKNM